MSPFAQAVATIQQQLQATDQHNLRVTILGLTKNGHWLKKLMDTKQYDQVASLTVAATVALPSDVSLIEYLQWYRTQALLKLGQPQQALSVAKGLFNVSRQQTTASALSLIVECLKAANPGDASVIERLRSEQTMGTALTNEHPTSNVERSTSNGAGSQLSAIGLRSSVLDGVTINATPYAAAIQQYTGATDYASLLSLGNLLLLSDRASDALPVFKQAYAIADAEHLAEASESLARCMRAQDGTIGRANAWVMSIRPR